MLAPRWRLWVCAIVIGVPGIAQAQRTAWQDTAGVMPPPLADFSAAAMRLRDSVVALARQQVGTKYVFGGESPGHGFDCSGLIHYIVSTLHLSLPRTAAEQASVGHAMPTDTSRLLPGDLVLFGKGKRASHIGVYVGNNRFIHASTKAGHVIESALLRPPARGIKPWRAVRRITVSDTLAVADSAG